MSRTTLCRQLVVLSLLFMAFDASVPAWAQGGNPDVWGKLWKSRYNGPAGSSDGATALGVSLDGASVFVSGYSFSSNGSYDYATVAYDAESGARRWVARYNGPGNGNDFASALRVSPDGASVFVSGYSFSSNGSYDYATVAYDAESGARRWVARYNGPSEGDDVAYALAVSPNGRNLFVTGYSSRSNCSFDYATVAYDAASGARRWVARYNGPGNGDDVAYALAVSPDGARVLVSGYSSGSNGTDDFATVAYDAASGARLWVARYNGPGNVDDVVTAVDVAPNGASVFVTGYSSGSGGSFDYATVAYDAARGTQRGSARIGPGSATALRVGPQGTALFVTGSVGTPISDYGTVAYGLVP